METLKMLHAQEIIFWKQFFSNGMSNLKLVIVSIAKVYLSYFFKKSKFLIFIERKAY